MARFGIYPATFSDDAPSSLGLAQIADISVNPNAQYEEIVAAGSLTRTVVPTSFAAPTITGSTQDLAGFFGKVDAATGWYCNADPAAVIYYQQRLNAAGFATTDSHRKTVATLGMMIPGSLSAPAEGPASVDWTFHALYDGSALPIVSTNYVAIAGTIEFNSQFYLDRVYIGSTQVTGLLSASIDFGIDFRPKRSDGDVFPRVGSIHGQRPTVSLTFDDLEIAPGTLTTWFGTSVSTLTLFLNQVNTVGGPRQANGNHLKIAIATSHWSGVESVTGEDDGTLVVSCLPTSAVAITLSQSYPT